VCRFCEYEFTPEEMTEIERSEQERMRQQAAEREKQQREKTERDKREIEALKKVELKKKRPEAEAEDRRWNRPEIVSMWGSTVLQCPQCATLNSIHLENCRRCSASLNLRRKSEIRTHSFLQRRQLCTAHHVGRKHRKTASSVYIAASHCHPAR
jgi:ribosomal protein L40E